MIPGHDQCAKTKTTAAFHDFGATVDEHDFFGRLPSFRRRSVLMTGIWSSALSWSALSWCCHEIKTLIHLGAPRRPALLLCLDTGIRRGRIRLCRSSCRAHVERLFIRQPRHSRDWLPVSLYQVELSPP